MDAKSQDPICVSEKKELSAPPGWTKKLVPASAKSITLRKFDVVFIAPDGQELKSKWHLTRYLKAHPEGPAISEFSWSSGEEAPIRRSSRFATKEVSDDNKSTSRKKGKRDAAEMEDDHAKAPSKKRAKKAEKSEASNEEQVAKVEKDVAEKDEDMHEVTAYDNETILDAVPHNEVQKNESEDANIVEAVTEKAMDEGLDEQVKVDDSSAAIGEHENIPAQVEGLDLPVVEEKTIVPSANVVVEEMTTVSSANIVGEHEEIQVVAVEVTKSISDNAENNEYKAAGETGTLVTPAEELKVFEAAMEKTVNESVELLDQELNENEGDVSCKINVVTSVVEGLSEEEPLGPLLQEEKPSGRLMQEEEPLELLTQKEDPVEPLTTQKEEPERPAHLQNSPQHINDKSSSEFNSSPAPLSVTNQ